MNPLSIKGLLARYQERMKAPQGVVCKEVVRVYGSLGIVCEEHDITYTPGTRIATVVATGPKRIEMLLRKHEALARIRQNLRAEDAPLDIV